MMQTVRWFDGDQLRTSVLPSSQDYVVPGVPWGTPDEILSPAYWAIAAQDSRSPTHGYVDTTADLVEELGFCLLGGFGVTVELASAYHQRLREEGVYASSQPDQPWILRLLTEPVVIGDRSVRYRFPNQRSARLAEALPAVREPDFPADDALELRNRLMSIPGIGPKTASWIVRNKLGSDEVAILDIHVVRACQTIGLFPPNANVNTSYALLESTFLTFSAALGVKPSVLDAVIWEGMRQFTPTSLRRLTQPVN